MRPRWLIAAALLYFAWLTWHADRELNAAYRVEGLERVYLPPSEDAVHYVIDHRPGPLFAEVLRRFYPERTGAAPSADTPEAWLAALEAAGVRAEIGPGREATVPPRVEFTEAGPALVLGTFNRQPLLFRPAIGTVLSKVPVLGPDNQAVYLIDAREVPW